jgi:hypothetical protein
MRAAGSYVLRVVLGVFFCFSCLKICYEKIYKKHDKYEDFAGQAGEPGTMRRMALQLCFAFKNN